MHLHLKQALKGLETELAPVASKALAAAKPQIEKIVEEELHRLGRPGETALAAAAVAGVDPGQIAGQVIDGVICGIKRSLGLPC